MNYPHQDKPYLEAKIVVSPENSTNHILDPTQNAVVSGTIIQFRIFDQITPIVLSLWIVPKYICPLVSFTLPKANSFMLSLGSDLIHDSFCVFTEDYENSHAYNYGSVSNNSASRLELYANDDLNPYDVCYEKFCKTNINGSIFFWFRFIDNSVSFQSFIRVDGYNSSDYNFPEPKPLPYYNVTNKYTVGHEFSTKTLKLVSYVSEEKMRWTQLASISTSLVVASVVVLKIITGCLIVWKSKKRANGHISYSSSNAQPITLVLNQYCPNMSAKLVMQSMTGY